MNKHIFTLFVTLLLTIFSLAASADNDPDRSDANIVGHVTDKTTGEHLPYINILLKGTMFYAATDATGHYFLKIFSRTCPKATSSWKSPAPDTRPRPVRSPSKKESPSSSISKSRKTSA